MKVTRLTRAPVIAILAVVAACLVASCSASTPSGSSPTGAKHVGGTARWAEAPGEQPDYIFPFMSLAYFTVANIKQFQYLMYRPLYWFGRGDEPTLNLGLSLAQQPVYSADDTTVVVNLKPYKWSDGETVTTQDVMFWMNMLHSDKADWAGYTPTFLPDNVKGITVDSSTRLTISLNAPVNPEWFTYNQLSQITPLPIAWDVTASGASAGSGGCSTAPFGQADAKCNAVYEFLSKQAGNNEPNAQSTDSVLATYATNPLWQVVDGPWRLAAFDASGNATFVPNRHYSGSSKPVLSKFVEVPFSTEADEYKALTDRRLNFGYLPLSAVTQPTTDPTVPTPNSASLSAFEAAPLYTWSIAYFPENFNSTGDAGNAGAIFRELYVRQALQDLIDQPSVIRTIYKGYGVPTYGPIPLIPSNPYVSSSEKKNPYPYSVSRAKKLLSSHGWKVVPGGTSICTAAGTGAGQCGSKIPAGAKLAFSLQFANGDTELEQLMEAERSSWAQAGINVTLSQSSFFTVIGNSTACTPGPTCTWELANWGANWVYTPDYYPTGEPNFLTNASSNSGSYSDPTNDQLITKTITTKTSVGTWASYLARQLPVVWQPSPVTELSEIQKTLRGVLPQDPTWNINPENWYYSK